MWDFLLVLGQVPGTNYQLTFYDIVGSTISVILLYILLKNQQLLFKRPVRKILQVRITLPKIRLPKLKLQLHKRVAENVKFTKIRNLPVVRPGINHSAKS